ncbi:hypothetical protein V1505DRAFT_379953 [Lipomyces doorenjongii]
MLGEISVAWLLVEWSVCVNPATQIHRGGSVNTSGNLPITTQPIPLIFYKTYKQVAQSDDINIPILDCGAYSLCLRIRDLRFSR